MSTRAGSLKVVTTENRLWSTDQSTAFLGADTAGRATNSCG